LITSFAWRYFRSKKSTNAINIIAWISMVAIAVVTAALIVVLSVFNGFENLVISLYSDFYSDLKVTPTTGKWMPVSDQALARLRTIEGVRGAEGIVQERAILVDQDDKSIVWLKGVSPGYASHSGVPGHMVRGQFETGTAEKPAVVVGAGVESALKIVAGQSPFPLTVYLPNRKAGMQADPLTALHSATAYPAGSFAIQQEFDDQYAFASIEFVRYLLDAGPADFTAVELYLEPSANVGSVKKQVAQILGPGVLLRTRIEQNQSLFTAMQAEKLIIYGVALLIMIIAAFNIISSLTMTVLEKQKDMAVLQAMGTTRGRVAGIFLVLGILLAGIGGLSGFVLGTLICLAQQKFHWVKLGGESFIIDYYPVALRFGDFVLVAASIVLVALFSGWLPARRAATAIYSLKS
jgi:lipoprotein-releasing system permease protein